MVVLAAHSTFKNRWWKGSWWTKIT